MLTGKVVVFVSAGMCCDGTEQLASVVMVTVVLNELYDATVNSDNSHGYI